MWRDTTPVAILTQRCSVERWRVLQRSSWLSNLFHQEAYGYGFKNSETLLNGC